MPGRLSSQSQLRGPRTNLTSKKSSRRSARPSAPPNQVNPFGKRSYGHVAAQSFPDVAPLKVHNLRKILKQNNVIFHMQDSREVLAKRYKLMVDQSACPNPKRRIVHASDNSETEEDVASSEDADFRPSSNSADVLDVEGTNSDSSIELPVPQKQSLSSVQSRPCPTVAHQRLRIRVMSSSDNEEETRPRRAAGAGPQNPSHSQEPVNESPSNIPVDDEQSEDNFSNAPSNPNHHATGRVRFSEGANDDRRQKSHQRYGPEGGIRLGNSCHSTNSDDEVDELADDQEQDGDQEMAPTDGIHQPHEESVSEQEDEDMSSSSEEPWVPPSDADSDCSSRDPPALQIVNNQQNFEEDVSENHHPPDVESLSTAELRAQVASKGFPCRALNREQLLELCREFANQERHCRTRSGQTFRNVSDEIPSSAPESFERNHQAPSDSEEEHSDAPSGQDCQSGRFSCRTMYDQLATEVDILKQTQNLQIAKIDETLRLVEEIRTTINQPKKVPRTSHALRGSSVPNAQRSDLRKLIRQHCAVLLGWTTHNKTFPHPATEGEKSEWGQPISTSSPQGRSGRSLYDHEAATPQQIEIIQRMMNQAGARRFAPNFLQPPNAPDNKFFWDLAVDIFVELMECGEYVNIDRELTHRAIISSEMRRYVRETLARRYKKENLWPQNKQIVHTTTQKRNSRRLHLVEQRLEVASRFKGLECLYPAIQAACSDDETDHEESPGEKRSRGRKHCKILRVPWRSKELTDLLVLLDDIDMVEKQSRFTKPSGPPPRVRIRDENFPSGTVQPKPGLPEDIYRPKWLGKITAQKHRGLQIQPPLKIERIARRLRKAA